jgi:hypothetical protein
VNWLKVTNSDITELRDHMIADRGLVSEARGRAQVGPGRLPLAKPVSEFGPTQTRIGVPTSEFGRLEINQISLGVELSGEVLSSLVSGGVSPPRLPGGAS